MTRSPKVIAPTKHPSGARPPRLKAEQIPAHVAVVMDGNGRWAKQRGLARTAGHEAGEASLLDVVHGAIEIGVKELSAYAFSTENWRRSPEEVKFLMGFNRDVIRRRRDEMNDLGVRIRWVGREQRLWKSVIHELQEAEELTKNNKILTLNMCVNYGGRAEIVDATIAIAAEISKRKIKPDQITEKLLSRHLYNPSMRDVDLFLRSSGELRTSNFLPWQSAYAEMVFLDVLWPDVDRRTLWQAIEIYAERERRFGKA
jgi:undecaprenyl diphosphate synthase